MQLSFNESGLLPPGDYELTSDELRQSLLVEGPKDGSIPNWDKERRLWLVNNAEILVRQLWAVAGSDLGRGKIGAIYLDGSFVTDKPRPNDIDGYFEIDLMSLDTVELQRALNLLVTDHIWTWSNHMRVFYPGGAEKSARKSERTRKC